MFWTANFIVQFDTEACKIMRSKIKLVNGTISHVNKW